MGGSGVGVMVGGSGEECEDGIILKIFISPSNRTSGTSTCTCSSG